MNNKPLDVLKETATLPQLYFSIFALFASSMLEAIHLNKTTNHSRCWADPSPCYCTSVAGSSLQLSLWALFGSQCINIHWSSNWKEMFNVNTNILLCIHFQMWHWQRIPECAVMVQLFLCSSESINPLWVVELDLTPMLFSAGIMFFPFFHWNPAERLCCDSSTLELQPSSAHI